MTAPVLSHSTEHGRYYTHPGRGKSVPSITNIKGMKAIPALPRWASKECATYVSKNIERLAGLTEDEIFQLVKGAPFAKSSSRDQASTVGDIVHDWIDQSIKGTPPADISTYIDKNGNTSATPLQAKQMWRQYSGFVDKYQPRWVASEFSVWSDTYGYAGTADWSAYIGSTLVLGDTKTGTGVYPDTAMQLAALAKADFILASDGTESPIPKFEKFAVLHVRPRFTRLVPVEHIEEWFKAFLGLKAVFDAVVNYEDTTLQYAPKVEVRAALWLIQIWQRQRNGLPSFTTS